MTQRGVETGSSEDMEEVVAGEKHNRCETAEECLAISLLVIRADRKHPNRRVGFDKEISR